MDKFAKYKRHFSIRGRLSRCCLFSLITLFSMQFHCGSASTQSRPTDSKPEKTNKPVFLSAICADGKIEMDGHCCWPGQTWQRDSCVGTPKCPVDFALEGDNCEPTCHPYQIMSEARCCWPEQRWSVEKTACIGVPDCPPGFKSDEDQCVPNPEVHQPNTRLIWRRCPTGQTWDGLNCQGDPLRIEWNEAKNTCPPEYRLPTIKELKVLLGSCDTAVEQGDMGNCASCTDSDTCHSMFKKDVGTYWSSSEFEKEHAWNALFDLGRIGWNRKVSLAAVRCVRESNKEP